MKKNILYFVAFTLICVQAMAQEPIKVKVEKYEAVSYRSYKHIHFDRDSIEIRKMAYPIVKYLGDMLKDELRIYTIQIEGFVDTEEFISKPYLALQRVNAVKDYFIKNGISAQRIIVKDGGKPEIPAFEVELEEENQELMRRVTFSLIKKE